MKINKIKKWFKEIAVTLIIVFVVVNIISYFRQPKPINQTFPNIGATLTNGAQFHTKDLKKKPFILHFWATWCPTCKLEISNFENLSKDYQVITVAVNSGTDQEVEQFLKGRNLHLKVINDQEGKLASYFGVKGFPTTFIFDKEKKVLTAEVGYTSTFKLKAWLWYLRALQKP